MAYPWSTDDVLLANELNSAYKYAVVADTTLTGHIGQVDFTGLDLETHGIYKLFVYFVANGTGPTISLYYNDDLTATNYDRFTIGGAQADNSIFIDGTANEDAFSTITIMKEAGVKPRAIAHSVERETPQMNTYGIVTASATTNVTKINIKSSNVDAIGTGTRIVLYKVIG